MWFKLNTTFTQSLGTLSELSNSWSITRNLTNYTTTSTVTSVAKNGTYSATFTLNSGCTYSSHSVTMGGATVSSASTASATAYKYDSTTHTITFSNFKVTGALVITAVATGASSGGGEPDTPTNYTFTITPDPISATVTLSATGYSTVSGTGSQSITVANGTEVNWSVSADGYTTRTGTWTANGENKTESIVLSETPAGNLMDVKSRLDANTEFVSGTDSTTQWGPFRGATPTVDGDCIKISCANAAQSLAGIRMGVPASVSALPAGTQVKITFSYKHDASYTPAGEYKFYTSSSASSFAYTTEWQQFSKTYTWNNDWDRLQISSATTLQKEAIFYVKDFSITVVS